ncbi:MAG: ribosomal protein [Dehalococcoidales bacterium]|nr:ribosomal protein [Dehalococcoidales bacterium]
MSREKKGQIIDKLEGAFTRSTVSILTDYRGLTTPEMTILRRRLQAADSEYEVVKNTLARLAAERAGKGNLAGSFEGPIAVAFGYGNIAAPVKALTGYMRDVKVLTIKAGFLGTRVLTPVEVLSLATLPSREILLSRVMGQMKSPISNLLGTLTAPMRGFVGVLQARMKQLEGE